MIEKTNTVKTITNEDIEEAVKINITKSKEFY